MTAKAARAAPHTFAGGFFRYCCNASFACHDTPDREREERQYARGMNPDHLCISCASRRDVKEGASQ